MPSLKIGDMQQIITKLKTSCSIAWLLAFACCKTPVIEPEKPGTGVQGTEILFPLNKPQFPGYAGDFLLSKLSDGTASGKLQLQGLKPGMRYFGKISRTSLSNPNAVIDFADLGECGTEKTSSVRHLKTDYRNQPVKFDSLLEMEAIIRVLELDPAGGFPKEVLRGDFGSNLLLPEEKNIQVSEAGQSGFNGSLTFRQRKNGNLLFSGNIAGLSGSDQLILSFFRGSPDGTFQRIKPALGQISAENAGSFSFSFPASGDGGLNGLDTLQGFIGFELPGHSEDSLDLKAIANFGGNTPTGNKQAYPVYSSLDSAVIASVELVEIGQPGSPLRMKFQFKPPFNNANQYLSLHRGTGLDPADTILSVKIPANGKFELKQIPDGNGGLLRFNSIDSWNAHIRLAENDPMGESNLSGSTDIGANEVLRDDSVTAYLTEQNPSFNITGYLIFRKRKNGDLLSYFRLSSTQSGVENNLLIRTGPKPTAIYDTTASICRIATFNGINPGLYKGFSKPAKPNGIPFTRSELQQAINDNAYLEYSFSDSGDFQVISRGTF